MGVIVIKKKVFIISGIILIAIVILFFTIYKQREEMRKIEYDKRYIQIKSDVEAEVKRYASVVHPNCANNTGGIIITHKTLVYNGGFDKEKLLDVDKKSYCSIYAKVDCQNSEHIYKIYLKCLKYEDEGFVEWEKPFDKKK